MEDTFRTGDTVIAPHSSIRVLPSSKNSIFIPAMGVECLLNYVVYHCFRKHTVIIQPMLFQVGGGTDTRAGGGGKGC